METITITKADGTQEAWEASKLLRSLKSAGAPDTLAQSIISHIEKDLVDGMRTADIYRHAFTLLKKEHRPLAAQYSLRKALLQLGPTGFPFERFIGQILEREGYKTQVGVMAHGMCVIHEVDVIAEKNDERIIVEAKYHNDPAVKTDVKVALYVYARYLDIMKRFEQTDGNAQTHFHRPWLITNTNFSSQAINYGTCVGLNMTGWNYPKGRTLQDIIQETQMHPLTCLTTLTNAQKQQLLISGLVLCQDILRKPEALRAIGISKDKIRTVITEGEALCTPTENML
jgi:hypothetical protein